MIPLIFSISSGPACAFLTSVLANLIGNACRQEEFLVASRDKDASTGDENYAHPSWNSG